VLTPNVKQIGTLPTAHPRAAGESQGQVAQSMTEKSVSDDQTAAAPPQSQQR
jgi:hypothetical protein